MKKIISLILAVVMIATFVPLTIGAFANDDTPANKCFIDKNSNGTFDDGEIAFETLYDAYAYDHPDESATNPTVITLLDDVTDAISIHSGRYITLNLKYNTLTCTYSIANALKSKYGADPTTYGNEFGWTSYCIINNGNLTIKGGRIFNCDEVTAIYNKPNATLNIWDSTFSSNNRTTTGGAVINEGDATFTGCMFSSNSSSYDAGAISNKGSLVLRNCNLAYNTAGGDGGAIASSDGSKCVLLNTVISYNSADGDGDGVYYGTYTDCLVAGTKITMADNTTKNVEDIVEGDIVKTFDHENGTFSSAKVYFTYKSEEIADTFRLIFDNGKTVECVTSYSFLNKATMKYVSITPENAESFIGEEFYGEDGKWHGLVNVEVGATDCVYEIYTAEHHTSIANGMLSAPADISYLLNIYALDTNLKADASQLSMDIVEFGLASYDYVSALCDMDKEWYTNCGAKYVNIAMAKRLVTLEECFGAYSYAGKLTTVDKFANDTLTIGAGTRIYSNGTSNVYLEKNEKITIYGDIIDTKTNVGVTLANTTGQFTTNGTIENTKYFTSDNADYNVYYNKNGYLEINTHTTCDFGEWTVVNDATCTTDGLKKRVCEVCGKEETETITKTTHTLNDWEVVTKATCETDGLKKRTCKNCDYYETETITKLGHQNVVAVFNSVNPTCTTVGGYDNYNVCARCKKSEFIEHITLNKTAHTPSEEYEDTDSYIAPTCTKDGTIDVVTVCTECNTELSRKTVTKGNKIDCTAGEWIVTKEATETETGLRVKKCTECGKVVKEEVIEKVTTTEPETDEPYSYDPVTEPTTDNEPNYDDDHSSRGLKCSMCDTYEKYKDNDNALIRFFVGLFHAIIHFVQTMKFITC